MPSFPHHVMIDYKVVKDPVHTSIELPSDFFRIVDDPLFQRLRNVKQTGLTHYVYPGLRHTRFEHSLGVAHLMLTSLTWIARNTIHVYGYNSEPAEIARSLLEDVRYWCAAGLAALLHDVGHLTWSHVFESALRDSNIIFLARRGMREKSAISLRKHEELTMQISYTLLAKHANGICGLRGEDAEHMVISALNILSLAYFKTTWHIGESEKKILQVPARLLSGTIDVDRGDYLLRDSRAAGVSYGLYDLDRLIRVLVLVPRHNGYDVGIIDKGVSVVENMLLGRMYMYTEVYMHDVVLSYEAAASRLLSLLVYIGLKGYESGYPGLSGAERKILECIARITQLELNDMSIEELTECMRLVTDPPIEMLVELLSHGTSEIYDMLKNLEDGKWACPALRIYSRVLTARRHPPTLYLNPEEASTLLYFVEGEEKENSEYARRVEEHIKPYIEHIAEDPMIVISHISPKIYDENEPVLVVRRNTKKVYRLQHIRTSAVAKLLGNIRTRSKVVIATPYLPLHAGTPLRMRPGKITESEVRDAYIRCGYSEQEAQEHMKRLRESLEAILQAITDLTRAL